MAGTREKYNDKIKNLGSLTFIINNELQKKRCNYRISFKYLETGNKAIFKVDKDGDLCANLGVFEKYEPMQKYLEGFYNALMFNS